VRLSAAIIDARPPPSADPDERGPSLLLAPLGSGTVLSRCLRWVRELTSEPVAILPAFAATDAYVRAIRRTDGVSVLSRGELQRRLRRLALTDWVLLVDPRLFALAPSSAAEVRAAAEDLRCATHWVALERADAEPLESVELDEFGQVSRVEQRYPDATRLRSLGTAFSLLPVAPLRDVEDVSIRTAAGLDWSSIAAIRGGLDSLGVLSREIAIVGGTIDIAEAGGLTRLIERSVHDLADGVLGRRWIGPGCKIDPSARVLGALVLQDGAQVGAGAIIAGPTLIGAGARIEADALIAQAAVTDRAVVKRGQVIRHRVHGDENSA